MNPTFYPVVYLAAARYKETLSLPTQSTVAMIIIITYSATVRGCWGLHFLET